MQIYRSVDTSTPDARGTYSGSLNEAHTHAKFIANRADARIELLEMATDKAAILLYLNGQVPDELLPPRRTWSLTDRGGLKEIANGE